MDHLRHQQQEECSETLKASLAGSSDLPQRLLRRKPVDCLDPRLRQLQDYLALMQPLNHKLEGSLDRQQLLHNHKVEGSLERHSLSKVVVSLAIQIHPNLLLPVGSLAIQTLPSLLQLVDSSDLQLRLHSLSRPVECLETRMQVVGCLEEVLRRSQHKVVGYLVV